MSLDNVGIVHSKLINKIYLYRQGKNPHIVLEKREAESDVMAALIDHMMHGAPNGSDKVITIGRKKYKVAVTPITD